MPKQRLTIRDWSGGINNRQDPRDIKPNEELFFSLTIVPFSTLSSPNTKQ